MKQIFTTIISLLLGCTAYLKAQTPKHEWVSAIGGSLVQEVKDMVIDSDGNTILIGAFEGTADFDPGTSTTNLTSSGSKDIFVQKLDTNGALLWVKRIGGSGGDVAEGVALDSNNNVHVVGYFSNTVDFDPGTGTVNRSSGGFFDAFLLKLDANGNYDWVQTIGRSGRIQVEQLFAITIDHLGNIITLGNFTGAFDMNPGSGSNWTTYSGSGSDIWLQKWNSSGSYVWGRYFGSSGNTINEVVTVDASNNIYFAGGHANSMDFQWGAGIGNLYPNAGQTDAYLVKYTSGGSYVFNYGFGGTGFDRISDIAIDGNNVYVTGQFTGSPDFNPGAASNIIASNGLNDAFISKFSTSGGYSWTRTFGSFRGEVGYGITTDATGNVYTTGYVGASTDFDPGSGVTQPTHLGGTFDSYVHKMDASGNFQWVAYVASFGPEQGIAIDINDKDEVIYAGQFSSLLSSSLDFSMGDSTAVISPSGSSDVFVHKIKECISVTSTDVQQACGSFTWVDGNTYTASNNTATFTYKGVTSSGCDSVVMLDLTIFNPTLQQSSAVACGSYTWIQTGLSYSMSGAYDDTLSNSQGCDSIIRLNLTIGSPSLDSTSISACNAYVWNQTGLTYTMSGSYSDTLTTSLGCDSIVRLDLTINQGFEVIDTVVSCGTYLWPRRGNLPYTNSGFYSDTLVAANGCDSILSLDLTVHQTTLTVSSPSACKSYLWPANGQTYTSSGTYRDTLTSSVGCDSIVMINLTIDTVNTSVTQNGHTLTANNNTRPVIFQWIDCNNGGAMITGANSASFTPSQSGSYAVIVSQGFGSCVDTSACFNVLSVGLETMETEVTLRAYPNPTSGQLSIEGIAEHSITEIRVRSITGKLVDRIPSNRIVNNSIVLKWEKGVYFLELIGLKGENSILKVIKQ